MAILTIRARKFPYVLALIMFLSNLYFLLFKKNKIIKMK